MSQTTKKQKTRIWELNGAMQNFSRKEKGSKSCNEAHTAFTILTRLMSSEELDALLYGATHGMIISLKIEVLIDESNTKDRKSLP